MFNGGLKMPVINGTVYARHSRGLHARVCGEDIFAQSIDALTEKIRIAKQCTSMCSHCKSYIINTAVGTESTETCDIDHEQAYLTWECRFLEARKLMKI
jgi:hypothetical protein